MKTWNLKEMTMKDQIAVEDIKIKLGENKLKKNKKFFLFARIKLLKKVKTFVRS